MKEQIFRKYDIRGIFPDDLDRDTVTRLGEAFGRMAGMGGTLAVGRDCRLSGAALFDWIASGAAATGCRILDLGMQTTPMTYFAAHTLHPDVTVMITGSHNPPDYNGFKVMKGLHTLHGEEITRIRDLAAGAGGRGDTPLVERVSILGDYLDRLRSEFCLDRALKVVVDAGNGTGGGVACSILRDLGCRVLEMFCEPDGRFPNHHPDPTVEANLAALRARVVEENADLGLAYDGDADRLGVVDDRGRMVFGDRILILLARDLLASNPGATVISEVKASSIFFSEVEKAGGKAVMCATGHSIIKEEMAGRGALLAGEMSGHIFFRDRYYGYDDALYASLRLLELLAGSGTSLSGMLDTIPAMLATPEIREDCPEELKTVLVDRVRRILAAKYRVSDIDGVRVEFPAGWGLLRASNTQPVLVMRFEAATAGDLASYEESMRLLLKEAREDLDV